MLCTVVVQYLKLLKHFIAISSAYKKPRYVSEVRRSSIPICYWTYDSGQPWRSNRNVQNGSVLALSLQSLAPGRGSDKKGSTLVKCIYSSLDDSENVQPLWLKCICAGGFIGMRLVSLQFLARTRGWRAYAIQPTSYICIS